MPSSPVTHLPLVIPSQTLTAGRVFSSLVLFQIMRFPLLTLSTGLVEVGWAGLCVLMHAVSRVSYNLLAPAADGCIRVMSRLAMQPARQVQPYDPSLRPVAYSPIK